MSTYALLWVLFPLLTFFWLRKSVNPKFKIPNSPGHYLGHSLWRHLVRVLSGQDSFQDLLSAYNEVKLSGKKFGIIQEPGRPNILIGDPELTKFLMVKHFEFATERRSFPELKSDKYVFRISQLFSGEKWRPTRNALTPAFTTRNLKEMFKIFDLSAQLLVAWMNERVSQDGGGGGTDLDCRIPIEKITLDIISKVAFGFDPKTFEFEESLFEAQVKKMERSGGSPIRLLLMFTFPWLANLLGLNFFPPGTQEFFGQVVQTEIERRKTGTAATEKPGDYLQFLIDRKKEGDPSTSLFSLDEIVGNSFFFITAGSHSNQSNLLSTLFQLATNPQVQNKLYVEIDKIFDHGGGEGHFLYEDINYLEYLDNVIKESLRMCPPAVMMERVTSEAFRIPDTDFLVDKGWLISVPAFGFQNDSRYFPSPEIFNPDRFSELNKKSIQSCSFLPFGEGPRHCFGKRVALLQIKITLCYLVLNFKFGVSAKTEIPMKYKDGGVLGPRMPAGKVWLKVEKRNLNRNQNQNINFV